MIVETDPYGPRDLEDPDDDPFDTPQEVVDALEELDRARGFAITPGLETDEVGIDITDRRPRDGGDASLARSGFERR